MASGNHQQFPPLLLELPASKDSVSIARNALSILSDGLPDSVFEDLKLLISELVTNSIRHTGLNNEDLIEVRVTRSPRIVRAEIADHGPGFKQQPTRPISERESGWGLFLVEEISDRWGLMGDKETRVWFEIDIEGNNQGAS